MAKSAPKRRLNRRAKRSIRRTLAVVMLITSIVVAAIPVPEAAATDGGTISGNNPDTPVLTAIEYPTLTEADDLDIKTGGISMTADGKPENKSYYVRQTSSGEYEYGWQFKYFIGDNQGNAVISKYNSMYTAEEVVLSDYITTKYKVLPETDYDNYYAETGPASQKQYSVTYNEYINVQINPAAKKFYETYGKAAFEARKKIWDDFKKKHDEWLASTDPNKPAEPTLAPGEETLTMTPLDLEEELRKQYYCEFELSCPGATLVKAIDRTADDGTPVRAYMPKGGDGGAGAQDGSGFWKETKGETPVPVIAIGDKAFMDVANVNVLKIAGEIKYIGDDAFLNSFISDIQFGNIETIGNRAFKNSPRLKTVTLSLGTKVIGNEAFHGSALQSIEIPYAVTKIGIGAFAECQSLQSITFAADAVGCDVSEFAFYNDIALNTVDANSVISLGKAAFAVKSGITGGWDTFIFPPKIDTVAKFGDYILAGRTNMKKVTMPSDFGRTLPEVEVPLNTFAGCINLENVEFPADGNGSCGYATYKKTMFANVINPNFYVRGPKNNSIDGVASPRKATWAASTQVSEAVPYVYTENGVDYYEVSKDNYLLLIDSKGELTSCEVVAKGTLAPGFELIIPEQVGTIRVQSIAPGCFDGDPQIKENVGSIVIKDGSVSKIGNQVFANCKMLTKVFVGNSVNSLGSEAFANCPKMTDITFNTPADGNYGAFTIGTDALTTGSDKLTVHADVVDGYAPFTWAMNPNNYVDKTSGTRVCYKGLAPRYMTVIINNDTNEPTLVDYPRYNEIDINNRDYIEELAFYYISKYGEQAQAAPPDPATIPACECCPDPREYDINSDYAKYIDDYSIVDKYENHVLNGVPTQFEWQTMTPKELEIINATKNLIVPSGITSIDAYQFFTDDAGSNANSISKYFKTSDINYDMCQPGDPKEDIQPGIFSGKYRDYSTDTQPEEADLYEKKLKGNDRVESITLTSVTRLPDYAFDSCERLQTVVLGDACKDIGTAPFRGCTNLVNVAGNKYYTSENGIIYSKKADGTLHIEECLPARGSSAENTIGTKYVTLETDPLLAQVTSIEEGAFQECDNITKVDFSAMEKLTVIPKECFKNCDDLSDVKLPKTVKEIREEAFAGIKGITVTIPAREVSIEDTAFDRNAGTIRTYKDSAAARYADYHELDLEYLEEGYRVTFLDYDGTELDVQYVEEGGTAVAPEVPKRKGYTFTGWSEDFKNVKKDLWIIAQYKTNSNSGGGGDNNNGGGSNNGGSSGSGTDDDNKNKNGIYNVTVINGTGSGTYKKGDTVTITANGPATGQKFDKWVTNSLNVAMANVTSISTTFTMPDNAVVVTATFKSDGTKPSNGTNTGNGTISGNNPSTTLPGYNSGTTIQINKPGISNTGLASAVVNGSSDKFRVVISESAEATAAIEAALRGQYGDRFDALRYVAMDISLYDASGTAKITNTQGLSVDITIPIPDALISYGGNNKAISVNNGALEHLGTRFTVIGGVPCMSFTATHFSPYGVYTDTQNQTASMDMTPKTGDGIHPKWFLAIGLMCSSVVLFTKRDEKKKVRTA